MKRLLTILGLLTAFFVGSNAQTGTWKNHLAYAEPQQIVKAGKLIYVRASNDLYSYNLDDHSIVTYDKVNGLSDTQIALIGWNEKSKRLIVFYNNANIDLIDNDGNIINISSFYSKSMTQDKTVNSIYMKDQYAYLATAFGVVKLNMERAEIAESYILNRNVTRIGIAGNNIYLEIDNFRVLSGQLNKNLIDSSNWQPSTDTPDNVFDVDNSAWNNYYEMVLTLKPGGPRYNEFGFIRMHKGKLYSVNNIMEAKGSVQVYDGSEWQIYENDIEAKIGHRYVGQTAVDIDPNDETHVFVSAQTGLFEFRNGLFVKEYTNDNSPLKTAQTVPGNVKDYVIVSDVVFDAKGSVWCANSISPSTSLLELTSDGVWKDHHSQKLMIPEGRSMEGMCSMLFTSDNYLFFVNDYHRTPAVVRYNPETSDIHLYTSCVNQDNVDYNGFYPRCLKEDRDKNLWIGSNIGLFMMTQADINSNNEVFTQIKVPRNDGSNYADYLLNGVDISCMAIDGGNRKWIGTYGNGVYLISADNMEQVQHFTSDNSPLLSDNIMSIGIDGTSGEVYFGTEQGLCSYRSDATNASDDDTSINEAVVYPNPVRKDYDGLITITGLTYNSDVMILSANGKLIAKGRSNGGSFTWNGRDNSGRRVASGIYFVTTSTQTGKKGPAAKIAIIN